MHNHPWILFCSHFFQFIPLPPQQLTKDSTGKNTTYLKICVHHFMDKSPMFCCGLFTIKRIFQKKRTKIDSRGDLFYRIYTNSYHVIRIIFCRALCNFDRIYTTLYNFVHCCMTLLISATRGEIPLLFFYDLESI